MASGDAAVAAGMSIVVGSSLASDLDKFENDTRDYIATYANRSGPLIDIRVQAADPGHKAGRVWIKTG